MKHILSILFIVAAMTSFGQTEKPSKFKEVTYDVSAVCKMCKDRIEKELNYTKGVVFCEVDLAAGNVTVKYKLKQITGEKIRDILVNMGYTTDGVERSEEGYNSLPQCCKGEGCGKK
ncbi:MAG: cation transporter [Crocinitomicaceae bacterium]|nr:cation transporter [Crocinitomicaceae bacterium]